MRRTHFLLLSLVAILAAWAPQRAAARAAQSPAAQAGTPFDLLAAVNGMRSSYGLAPYVMDGTLMAMAQQHSDYMASIRSFTHLRADGSGPKDYGITAENIGGGLNVSPHYMVYTQWADDLHTNTIIGYSEGLAGAGATVVDGYVYYTLDVKRTGEFTNLANTQPVVPAGSQAAQPTSPPKTAEPLTTATPMADGSLVHVVKEGETLWAIAISYGVKIDDLARLNPGVSADRPTVYIGQKIVVRAAFTPTVSSTVTDTPVPATSTPRPTATLRPTRTKAPTRTATEPSILPEIPAWGSGQVRPLGLAIIIICALGLLGVLAASLRRKDR